MSELQQFGGPWTEKKLDAIDSYLKAYNLVLKNLPFKRCYIDAFSGSGNIVLRDGRVVDGSAVRALKHPFDKYYFFEKDQKCFDALCDKVRHDYSEKVDKVSIVKCDCNELLQNIDEADWFSENWRGVIFLDPYAMQLDWSCLAKINKTQAFDVWYLFPFSAVTRNLTKNGKISPANKDILTKIFGLPDWEEALYSKSLQIPLFGEPSSEKTSVEGLKQYILRRLKDTFCAVSPNPALLRSETKNAPLFLLCFAMSNPSEKAQKRALTIANHILGSISMR